MARGRGCERERERRRFFLSLSLSPPNSYLFTSPPSSRTKTSPCSKGDIVPASVLRYGSVFFLKVGFFFFQRKRGFFFFERPFVDDGSGSDSSSGGRGSFLLSLSHLSALPILIDVTRCPHALSSTPIDEAVTPLPSPETTPPVTTLEWFCFCFFEESILISTEQRERVEGEGETTAHCEG